jgi:hypothetical protein
MGPTAGASGVRAKQSSRTCVASLALQLLVPGGLAQAVLKRNKTREALPSRCDPIVLVRTDSNRVFALERPLARHSAIPAQQGGSARGEQDSSAGITPGGYDRPPVRSGAFLIWPTVPPRRCRRRAGVTRAGGVRASSSCSLGDPALAEAYGVPRCALVRLEAIQGDAVRPRSCAVTSTILDTRTLYGIWNHQILAPAPHGERGESPN